MSEMDKAFRAVDNAFKGADKAFKGADKAFKEVDKAFFEASRSMSPEPNLKSSSGSVVIPLTWRNRLRFIKLAFSRGGR